MVIIIYHNDENDLNDAIKNIVSFLSPSKKMCRGYCVGLLLPDPQVRPKTGKNVIIKDGGDFPWLIFCEAQHANNYVPGLSCLDVKRSGRIKDSLIERL